jgi:solute:Na+ symporter, SSS family
MNWLDWTVMFSTLIGIVLYGVWKTRQNNNVQGFLKGGNQLNWSTIGLSVMATQASAITFISMPGMAYESGMGFIQNYIGLPIAIIIVCAFFLPIYYKLNVYTAYEYLETRFGLKNRLLAAFLFLLQRGFAAGITIYAPAIILSTALGWNLNFTILLVGIFVIVYTVSGGTKAVSLTQKWQMLVILAGIFIAFLVIVDQISPHLTFVQSLQLASTLDKLDMINFSFDLNERYTFWSGITGGLFLALSYFGTDQSQVQRYIGGQSEAQSKTGLLFNALLKLPMQFFILLLGVMVFVFFQFKDHPVLFNQHELAKVYQTSYSSDMQELEEKHKVNAHAKRLLINDIFNKNDQTALEKQKLELKKLNHESFVLKQEANQVLKTAVPQSKSKDSDYIFLSFIIQYMPHGLIGLLMAVILSAAMSSTAGELNALASTSSIDFYKRIIKPNEDNRHYMFMSRVFTAMWGTIAIFFALFAYLVENLIEAVNILASMFYGTILGVFLVAFMLKKVKGNAIFVATIISQILIFAMYFYFQNDIAYLWYNFIGCIMVMTLAWLLSMFKFN